MTAALFGISASYLLRMNGPEIRNLFDTTKANWYQGLGDSMEDLSWDKFGRGWLHAAAGILL
jgi:hypothetical protein